MPSAVVVRLRHLRASMGQSRFLKRPHIWRAHPMGMAMNATRQTDPLMQLASELQGPAEISADGRLIVEAMTALPAEAGTFQVRLFRWDGDPAEHLAVSV